MSEPTRVPPGYVRDRMQSGAETLLVCAYDEPEKCAKLDGSIALPELAALRATLPKSREIVFFCS